MALMLVKHIHSLNSKFFIKTDFFVCVIYMYLSWLINFVVNAESCTEWTVFMLARDIKTLFFCW